MPGNDCRLKVLVLVTLLSLYFMISTLISVTRLDAKTLAERRIHSADIHHVPGRMMDRKMIVKHNQERRRVEARLVISWCRGPPRLKAAPGLTTGLVSAPGSGNTWLRYLLQQLTGVSTGSVYKDVALLRNGFPAESVNNGSVIAVKTHEWGGQARNSFQAALLLVRDPFDSILAEFNRRSGGHIGHASLEKFRKESGKVWQDFVIEKAKDWENINMDWAMNFKGPLLVIHYDNLVERLEEELKRVLEFLSVSFTEADMKCVVERKEGIYRRKKKAGNLKALLYNSFLTSQVNKSKEKVLRFIKEKFRE